MDHFIIAADPDEVDQERRKAKQLKKTPWWKNRLGEGKCYYCGERHHPKSLTMDHMTPLIRGGKTSKSNCVPACAKCNKLKENLPPAQWQAVMDELLK
jgi:5-methylcytosine-specific restriction enzyme A